MIRNHKQFKAYVIIMVIINIFVIYKPVYSYALSDYSDKDDKLPNNLIYALFKGNENEYLGKGETSIDIINEKSAYTISIKNNDGSITAHTFGSPVRYIDSNGDYKFIDTTFIPISKSEKVTSDYDYVNKANGFNVYFSDNPAYGMSFDGMFSMTFDGLSMNYSCRTMVDVDDNLDGRITYFNSFGKNIDTEYVNISTGIKENIIIKERSKINTFSFKWSSELYKPVLSEDHKKVYIISMDRPSSIDYVMQEMYMFDSYMQNYTNKSETEAFYRHFSEDCFYDVNEISKNKYIITITVSKDFLNNENTVYPVTIDPTITAIKTAANIQDTFASEGKPTTNYGSDTYIRIGYYPYHTSTAHKMYGFIKYNTLPSINLENYLISSADLTLYLCSGTTTAPKTTLSTVTTSWSENSLTWNNKPNGGNPYIRANNSNNCTQYLYNATEIVKYWYNISNIGACITYTNETSNDFNLLYSSDNSATAKAPLLRITYKSKNVYINSNQQGANSSFSRNAAATFAKDNATYNVDNPNSIYDSPNYLRVGTALSAPQDNNCTNFVSACLHEGGMIYLGSTGSDISNWKYGTILYLYYNASETWGRAATFANHWGVNLSSGTGVKRAYKTIIYDSAEDVLNDWFYLCETVGKGDVVQTAISNNTPNHSMIIYAKSSDTIKYAQHTGPANQEKYNLKTKLTEYKTSHPECKWIFYVIK